MNDLFVSYDLKKYRDYPRLWDELRRLGGRRALESVWELQSHSNPKQMRDHLAQFIDSDDRLLVMNVSEWAGLRLANWPATTTTRV